MFIPHHPVPISTVRYRFSALLASSNDGVARAAPATNEARTKSRRCMVMMTLSFIEGWNEDPNGPRHAKAARFAADMAPILIPQTRHGKAATSNHGPAGTVTA